MGLSLILYFSKIAMVQWYAYVLCIWVKSILRCVQDSDVRGWPNACYLKPRGGLVGPVSVKSDLVGYRVYL